MHLGPGDYILAATQKRLAKEAKEHERLRKAAEKVPDLACWAVPCMWHFLQSIALGQDGDSTDIAAERRGP